MHDSYELLWKFYGVFGIFLKHDNFSAFFTKESHTVLEQHASKYWQNFLLWVNFSSHSRKHVMLAVQTKTKCFCANTKSTIIYWLTCWTTSPSLWLYTEGSRASTSVTSMLMIRVATNSVTRTQSVNTSSFNRNKHVSKKHILPECVCGSILWAQWCNVSCMCY